jgi:hypothetical protein
VETSLASDAGIVPYRATAVVTGTEHTCALLDDGHVKCWGFNTAGQLGYGDTYRRGGDPRDMGDALPIVDLGTGRLATALAAGGLATCAILDDGSLKCWGDGDLDGTNGGAPNIGDAPGEMGDALRPIDLGGRRARQAALGRNIGCVLADDGAVVCWGAAVGTLVPTVALVPTVPVTKIVGADQGMLVLFADGTAGSVPASQFVLAAGVRATEIEGMWSQFCALVNGVISCGGLGTASIDGRDDFYAYGIGGEIFTAPATPPRVVSFGLAYGGACAIFADDTIGCQRLLITMGCTPDWCAQSQAAGDGTLFIQLGQSAKSLSSGGMNHVCALLADGGVRCWGYLSTSSPNDALGSSFDLTETNGQWSYGPFHSIDLGHH